MTGILKTIAGLALILALFLPAQAMAAGKVALVIGNGAYRAMPALRNPANDANLIAAKLDDLGFDIVRIIDGDRRDFWDGLTDFGRRAQNADVALVFYAGHGVQVNGSNWLLPVDAEIEASTDLPAQALKADDLLEIMEASGARLKLVFFDACRNNPLPRSLARGADNGLARLEANAAGMMIAFATSPGNVALDGSGNNSPFTEALAGLIGTPDLEVRHLMGKVREAVYSSTGERQLPWLNEALIGEFYFGGRSGGETASPQTSPQPSQETSSMSMDAPATSQASLTPSRAEPAALPVPSYSGGTCSDAVAAGSRLRICASSVLDPQYGNRYGPGNLSDGNLATAWVEGVTGTGAGQRVLIAFDRPRRLAGFEVVNGYAKNRDIYRKNARLKTVILRLSDGSSQNLDLPDDMRASRFTFGAPLEATWLELEIGSVFAGSKYADTALSELVPIFAD
ncbi:NADase-type glycan-binding domain-containing protein [Roseibium sp. M-1]